MNQKGGSQTLAQGTASEETTYSQYMKPYGPYSDESDIQSDSQQATESWKHENDASTNTKYDTIKHKSKTNLSSQTKDTVLNSPFYDETSDYVTDDVKSSTFHASDEVHSPTPGAAALQKQIDPYNEYLTSELSDVVKLPVKHSQQKMPLTEKNEYSKYHEKSKMHQDIVKTKDAQSLYSYKLRRQPTLFSIVSPDEQSQPDQFFSDGDYIPEVVQEEPIHTEDAANSSTINDDTFESVQNEPVDTKNTAATATVEEDTPRDLQEEPMRIDNASSTTASNKACSSQLSDRVTQDTYQEAQTTNKNTSTAQTNDDQSTENIANPSTTTNIVNNQHESITDENVNNELNKLLQDKYSPLAEADMKKLIPQVLKKLPAKKRNELCSYLPLPDVNSGKITQDFIKHGNTIFWESATLWQQFLSAGSFNPSRKRKEREENTESPFKDDQYEEYWGAKIEKARKKKTRTSSRNK
ncbi:hypothetical protein BCV72DRAFT_306611 [Rhizopus microsporus var. microsporus]|uniref:ASX DEUBAD domain-containing protein n=2 Tax=Rhizopus microsporus TaxID=58291 RepID=A0A2G4SXZ1_RHIZD|nr:uncharacterized protein RHIMIDRAFT_237249 [Rhizopus microsporus ATCC 52813]ORE05221.1 hypothetical protein BCV72DRAFT_306611 [Rhizopus microsporus var. microsporus]PHZ13236.1 hypothetical protein RHIMIDRAFT_237249 [Rhizopus microsporus ATCC 52813]